jgi:hypothetical protein
VVPLVVLALAGCSVPVTGGTGVIVEDGHVKAVVQMCSGDSANEVYLRSAPRSDDRWDGATWRFESANYATIDLGTLDEFLGPIGDRRVQLQSNSSGGVGGWVEFEAGDVRELGDNEILTFSWSADESLPLDMTSEGGGAPSPALQGSLVVAPTGVDPVTSRFSVLSRP